ncbi:MAG: hypothetical protein ACMUIE_10520 [Thermoplasmatota archaeon]
MGEGESVFYGTANVSDHIRIKMYEALFWVSGISLFLALLIAPMMFGSELSEGGSFFDAVVVGVFSFVFLLGNGLLVLGLMYLVANTGKLKMARDWDKNPLIIYKLTETHLIISQRIWDKERLENRIHLDLIKDTEGDVVGHLNKVKVKLPWWYRPFLQASPDPKKHPSLLYGIPGKSAIPINYLVRLDLETELPLRYMITGSFINTGKGFFSKMKYVPQYGKWPSSTFIISIRPDDHESFRSIIKTNRKKLKTAPKASVLEPPPG